MKRLVITALVACAPAAAFAEEAPTSPTEFQPHLALTGTVGIATPLGEAGLELEGHIARYLSLSAGIGLGASGTQLAAMARAHVPISDVSNLYFGLGTSGGKYTWNELVFDEPAQKTWHRAYWLNGELGIEKTLYDEYLVRFFGGVGMVLNDQDYMCTSDDVQHCLNDHQNDGNTQVYVGLAFGKSL